MTGTAVNWLIGAALATVASVAGRRLVRWRRPRAGTRRLDSAVHLVMAFGMAAMLAPADMVPTTALLPVLRWSFAGLALALLLSRGGHRLHHAAMAGVMALMAEPPRHTAASAMAPGMLMPTPMQPGVSESSPLLLAAFGYACVSALVIAWRLPAPAHSRAAHGGAHGAVDPLGRACEVVMFMSMAVMLLPMV